MKNVKICLYFHTYIYLFLTRNIFLTFVFERVLFLARPQTLRRTENMVTIDAFNVTEMTITNKTSYGFPREELLTNFFREKIQLILWPSASSHNTNNKAENLKLTRATSRVPSKRYSFSCSDTLSFTCMTSMTWILWKCLLHHYIWIHARII